MGDGVEEGFGEHGDFEGCRERSSEGCETC